MHKSFKHIYTFLGLLLFSTSFIISCGKKATSNYFPELGKDAVRQRLNELNSNLNVLSLAIEPGHEDLAALAYYRLEKGANILSAYLTNGETGVSDSWNEYPDYIAATRRTEAGDALEYLDGDVHFLNLPDIAAARDTLKIREKWSKHKVMEKLRVLINVFKPDIILFAKDWKWGEESLRWAVFKNDLLTILHEMDSNQGKNMGENWSPYKVLEEQMAGNGDLLPIRSHHSISGKRYVTIGEEAGEKYQSLAVQKNKWSEQRGSRYSILFPFNSDSKKIDAEMPARYSHRLNEIAKVVSQLKQNLKAETKEEALKNVVAALDSVTFKIQRRFEYSKKDQRTLLHWKKSLEELRCSLLGVAVNYTVSEDTLTMVQLTYVTINDVTGIEEEGETTVYFGGLGSKWVINEGFEKKFKYRPGDSYRLLSPKQLTLTTPQAKYGLNSAKIRQPVFLFVLHEGLTKEKSFIHRSKMYFYYAPKFSTEILTPIVMMVPNEKLVLKFTNHSRDGTKDTVKVEHELVESTPGLFRLNQKGSVYLDTLTLIWKGNQEPGNYIIPIDIRGFNIGNFAVRNFDFKMDRNKKIGVIEGVLNSPIFPALRRLGVPAIKLTLKGNLYEQINELDVVIVDRLATTFKENLKNSKSELERFADNGGHLIYFRQEADIWNKHQWIEGVELTPAWQYDESVIFELDDSHPFVNNPNELSPQDWGNWLFLTAYNSVNVDNSMGYSIPLKTNRDENPLILTKTRGKGKTTYIDLAIYPQLMNIHEGAYKLLANIISN
ncbi:PIG-L family deacetylase [candidate division KSB1 bacterium]|nr:PIG-L family deacetylase [candidate division KSB1 bacterium]